MKLFSKIVVVAAVFMLASVFTGCKNAEEEDSVVAEFYTEHDELFKVPVTLTFYDDDSFDIIYDFTSKSGKEELFFKGTYKGDPTKDGKIKLTATECVDIDDVAYTGKIELEETDDECTVEIINDEIKFLGIFTVKRR